VLRVQSAIMYASRRFFEQEGFLEVRPPVIEPFTDPGLRGAGFFEVDFYGRPYRLMSALTVHKPLLATHLGKIFSFCPCLRVEDEKSAQTGRHLAEFYQIEVEVPETDHFGAMKVAEGLVSYVLAEVKKKCSVELKLLDRDFAVPKTPFKRLSHRDAVEMAKRLGFETHYDKELPWEAERALSEQFGEPFFITDYPLGSRGFYDRDGEGCLMDFDLMYPEGYGEAASGSAREYKYDKVREKVGRLGLGGYERYLELIKEGVKPTAGFGVGLERLTRYVCGLEHIRDATPFAKVPGG